MRYRHHTLLIGLALIGILGSVFHCMSALPSDRSAEQKALGKLLGCDQSATIVTVFEPRRWLSGHREESITHVELHSPQIGNGVLSELRVCPHLERLVIWDGELSKSHVREMELGCSNFIVVLINCRIADDAADSLDQMVRRGRIVLP